MTIDAILAEADAAWLKGLANRARDLYLQALVIDPATPMALQRLAWLEDNAGKTRNAIELMQRLIVVAPNDCRAQLNLGLCLQKVGERDAAAAAFRRATEINPLYSAAFCNLGLLLEEMGDTPAAVEALQSAMKLSPASEFIAYHLAAVAGSKPPGKCPADYLVLLFDGYADQFDQHLFEVLGYTGPRLLAEIVGDRGPSGPWDVMDLGCGTGMTAVPFREKAGSVTGVDLSPRMLQHAARRITAQGRRVYDTLLQSDIVVELQQRRGALDLLLAADVFIYIGDLAPVFSAAATSLRPGGLFAFTTESFDGPDDFKLLPTRRYAHHCKYVEQTALNAGLEVLERRSAVLRAGADGQPVDGNVLLLGRPLS